jgi:hypothetical protein
MFCYHSVNRPSGSVLSTSYSTELRCAFIDTSEQYRLHLNKVYEGVSKSFRTESITKYTLTTINTRWEAMQRVMAAKLSRLTHKIAIQLHLVAESCTICICCSRRPVRKLLVTLSYTESCVGEFRYVCSHPPVTCRMHEIGSIPSYSSVKYCAVCTCTLNKGEKCSWVGRAFQIRLVGSLRTLWL